jgi:regulator of protease activity HflC (stomatin/prohibitin superfamily)
MAREFLVPETHQGLLYRDGVFARRLPPGRHHFARRWSELFSRMPVLTVLKVDMRARELTIKGQEILTADKVALRVSILVQFAVVEPEAAHHTVENFEDRLYSDVQLAARRALARMTLEDMLTNRTRLSADILDEVKEAAGRYGVAIARADVKDLSFPGNVQEVMNRVLTAERQGQAQLIEARTKAEIQRIEAETRAESERLKTQAESEAVRAAARAKAEATAVLVQAETEALERRRLNAAAYGEHPALLRLEELASLRALATNANARLHLSLGPTPLGAGLSGD